MLEIGGLLSSVQFTWDNLPAKTFRRAAKTGITAPTFIRAMCATHVMGQYLRLRCKEEAERVTVQLLVRVDQSHTVDTVVESCTCADTHSDLCQMCPPNVEK